MSLLTHCLSWRALAWGESNTLNFHFAWQDLDLPLCAACTSHQPTDYAGWKRLVYLSQAASLCIKYFKVCWEKDKKHKRSFHRLTVWILRSYEPWGIVPVSKTGYLCSGFSRRLYNHFPEAQTRTQDQTRVTARLYIDWWGGDQNDWTASGLGYVFCILGKCRSCSSPQ